MDKYLTVVEAANFLHIHPETMRQWIRDGRIEAKKPGKIYYIPLSALKQYIEGPPITSDAETAAVS